jgi:hypothetical protein
LFFILDKKDIASIIEDLAIIDEVAEKGEDIEDDGIQERGKDYPFFI